jgi:serine/threonine protein kinase/Tfp pilus assembly protein PilF
MIGKTFLHYKIIEELGRGGMGVVYKAEDTKLKRHVAIKFLPHHISSSSEEKDRFAIEAQAAAALSHPNIAHIYAIEEADGEIFIVMEYIEGQELKDLVGNGRDRSLPIDDVINYVIQIAEGLQAAHKKGIVHRDIKSSNVMVTETGQIKIMDFGLAKMQGMSQLTKAGSTVGTTAYMSPEQVRGEEVDPRTDIWSLGVVLYEMLTGQFPFKGAYEQAVLYAILNEEPDKLNQENDQVPLPLESIIEKALAKNPDDRYKDAGELLNDLNLLRHTTKKSGKILPEAFSFADKTDQTKQLPVVKKSYWRYALFLLAVIIAGIALYRLIPEFLSDGIEPALPKEKHIVVLPLNVIGEEKESRVLADGLVETVTSKLSQLEQFQGTLWVVPTSEMRNSNLKSPSEARQAFGINLAVTGSIQKFDTRFRLILNLIDPVKKRQVNSKIIDEPLSNISFIQDEAVVKVAEMLNVEMNEQIQKVISAGGTTIPGANEFYLQGRGYLQRYDKVDNVRAAIELFERAVKEDPNFASAYAGLGEASLRMYNQSKDVSWIEKAESNCQKAVEINRDLVPVHLTLGLLYIETGKYEVAHQKFQEAMELDPANVEAYLGQATAFSEQGKLDEAESIYKKVIAMKPDYWAGYNHLGIFYYLHGRYHDAAIQFEQVVKLTPLNAGAYRNLGAMYFYLDQRADAIIMFKRALEIEPDYSIYSNLATLYFYEALYKESASMYEKALELQDTDYEVWGYLASAYRYGGDEKAKMVEAFEKAKSLAEKQLKINPSDQFVLSSIAGFYEGLGEPDSALILLKKIEALKPKEVEIMFRLGDIYEQLGNRDKALYWVEKSVQNGYPLKELERMPGLEELRSDERYHKKIAGIN